MSESVNAIRLMTGGVMIRMMADGKYDNICGYIGHTTATTCLNDLPVWEKLERQVGHYTKHMDKLCELLLSSNRR